jgi:hypothetical protein
VVLLLAGYAAVLLRHIYLTTFSKSHRLIQTAHRLKPFLKKFEPDCQAEADFLMAYQLRSSTTPTRTLVDHRQLMACFDQIERRVDNELLTMAGMKESMLAMATYYHQLGHGRLNLVAVQCAHIYDIKIEYLETLHASVSQKTLEVSRIFRFAELVYQNTDISLVTEGKELDVCAICLLRRHDRRETALRAAELQAPLPRRLLRKLGHPTASLPHLQGQCTEFVVRY